MRACLVIAALLIASALQAQKVMQFSQLETEGIRQTWLDSNYTSAVHSDTALAVFKTEKAQEEFIGAYNIFIQNLGKFLAENGFVFKQEQRCFNRVYFAADGSVEYFIYSFSNKNIEPQNQLTAQQLSEFERLLIAFLKTEKLPFTTAVPFAQCSPVVYGKK
ncbi:MAG: hypothetical protein ACK5Z2_05810 [Bacteroidota bacterium]|jgi:hypothetical protein